MIPTNGPAGRWRVAAAGATIVALLAAAGCATDRAPDSPTAMYQRDKRVAAPALTGDLLEGGRYDLGQHRGEVIVVNFWASWCPPCRDELPELVAVYEATRDKPVTFLGINVRDERDKARAFVEARPTGYQSIYDPAGESAMQFKVPPNTIPATLVIDRRGRIAAVFRKALLRDELRPVVDRLAREPS